MQENVRREGFHGEAACARLTQSVGDQGNGKELFLLCFFLCP